MPASPSRLERFGEIAVRLGFATPEQIGPALAQQEALSRESSSHRLIGVLLVEMGAMSTAQVVRVLKEMSQAGENRFRPA